MTKRILSICALLCALSVLAFGQATMTQTTASAAIAINDEYFTVASATGITAMGFNNQVNTVLYADREAMTVRSISGTRVRVFRGQFSSRQQAHASGATIYVGPPEYFFFEDEAGGCTSTAEMVLPHVVIPTGRVYNCISSQWKESELAEPTTGLHVGAAETGVTAVEYGDARSHITKLTFTNLAIGSATGAADLGFGKKIYTLPTGALVVKVAYMSVALTGSGATCDADTPDGGIGTVIASGVVNVLSGTATFENILTGQTFNNLTGTAEVKTVSNQILTIESADAHGVFVNLADGWAGACDVTGTGTVTIEWAYLP